MPTVVRSGSEEMTCDGVQRLAAGDDLGDLAALDASRVTGAFIRTSPPCSRMSSVICSHIWPGPKRG